MLIYVPIVKHPWGGMKIYSISDLEKEGVKPEEVKIQSQIHCFQKKFLRAADFPKKYKNQALDACYAHREEGLDSFLVETPLFITVWKEYKEREREIINPISPSYNTPEQEETTLEVNPYLAPQKKRKYRGITYE